MILQRLTANLRAQNWTAVTIEFVIVVTGVFIGTQVANWNNQRLEKRETGRLLEQLRPELQSFTDFFASARSYYATTRAFSKTAFAGWANDPRVTDEQFVIAAYQASQIYGLSTNGNNWALIFGGDQLRNIDNLKIRRGLATLMTLDYAQLDTGAVATRYREDVRRIIPDEVQQAIRAKCGDRPRPDMPLMAFLPSTCRLALRAEVAAASAAALRARPKLVEDLRWQLAAEATLLTNMELFEITTRDLAKRIAALE